VTPVSRDDATAAFYSALADDDPAELYDNAPCGYLSALPDGTIIKANATFLTWTGYERDKLVGRRRFQDLLATGDRIFYETHAAPMLFMQGMLREIAVEVIGASGLRLPMLMNALLKRDDDGQPQVIRAVLFDAGERLAYERELVAARCRAEESEARARILAETLQRSFLPRAIVALPGLDVGGAYRPAGDGSEVGGDFYDVFQTSRDTQAIVLGDVCGKGASAAVVTALARYTVRAEALHVSSPTAVLAGLHEALVSSYPDTYLTVLFLLLDQVPEGHRMRVATGGHPLPLCRRADGSMETLGHPGSFLGMAETAEISEFATLLRPGDMVVLYTDGVTEARQGGSFFGEAGLAEVAGASAGCPAQAVADAIVAAALAFQHGPARDDIAVVVVKVPPLSGPGPLSRRVAVPASR
jgi:phosphoserine phosphatase RsbU/P